MTTYALCLGVNHYLDPVGGLHCAEADARELAAVLKQKLGFEAAYLEEREAAKIMQRIDDMRSRLRAGDQFIFYFSGHGKVQGDEQYFLLPQTRLNLLEKGMVTDVLSWRALLEITSGKAWQDVARIFIFDACRHPLLTDRGAGELARFDGTVLLRAPLPVCDHAYAPSSWGLLNSCNEGKSAAELPALGHGIFTLALLEYLHDKFGRCRQLIFDSACANELKLRMLRLSHAHNLPQMSQEPVWRGEALALPLDQMQANSASGPSAATRDEREWQLVLLDPTLDRLHAYVRSAVDDAAHVDEAMQMIATLKRQMQDEENWRRIQISKKVIDWETYLQKAPDDSPYRKDARRRLTQLQEQLKLWQVLRMLAGSLLLGCTLVLGGWWLRGKLEPTDAAQPITSAPAKTFVAALPTGSTPVNDSVTTLPHGSNPDRAAVPVPTPAASTSEPDQPRLNALDKLKHAAEKGDAKAQYEWAWRLLEGRGVNKDVRLAMIWLQKAAEQNHANAQADLGYMYENNLGTKQAGIEAVTWYRKAAAQNNARGQAYLGFAYESGRGVKKDPDMAVYWYEKSAGQGHAYGQAKLGRMYENGLGVKKSLSTAVLLYEKSAAQGNQEGQYNLACLYETGKGVERDLSKAMGLYRKAAVQGSEEAKITLQRLEKARP